MKRFLNKLFRDPMTSGKGQRGRPAARRTMLQAEGLEDRMVLSSVFQNGSTLFIELSAGANIELVELNPTGNRQIVVEQGPKINQEFSINTIKAVDITVAGNNSITINDSDGMPFATGSTISLTGSGTNNSLDLNGTRAFDTGELYVVGGTSSTLSTLKEDGLNFQFNNAIGSVTDTIQLTGGPLDVATAGQNVVLSSNGNEQTLSGMGPGGGGTFTYADKSVIDLNEFASDATVNLDATRAAELETSFSVVTNNPGDIVTVAATNVPTSVHTIGGDSEVVLLTNVTPVSVVGNSTSSMIVGQLQSNGNDLTKGIQANVAVQDMRLLLLSDDGNVSTKENVTVTENTISGTGLFGNNAAEISYSGVNNVSLFSGQLEDSYTVEGSGFSSQINIFDDSSLSFDAHVFVNPNSNLHLDLDNLTKKPGELFIEASGGKFSSPSNGVIDVFNSQIDFQGFIVEEERS